MSDARDELKLYLETRGVETKIQHPILMPFHSAYKEPGVYPVAEAIVQRILCLPLYDTLPVEEIERICQFITEV